MVNLNFTQPAPRLLESISLDFCHYVCMSVALLSALNKIPTIPLNTTQYNYIKVVIGQFILLSFIANY